MRYKDRILRIRLALISLHHNITICYYCPHMKAMINHRILKTISTVAQVKLILPIIFLQHNIFHSENNFDTDI